MLHRLFSTRRHRRSDRQIEREARITPPPPVDTLPDYLAPIIDAVGNWETDYEAVLAMCHRRYLDHIYAPIKLVDDAMLEIALEGQQISDELTSRCPDLVRKSLGADHPLTVMLIEEENRP